MTDQLAALRTSLLTAGYTATSSPELDDEDRRIIREEAQAR